MRYNLLLSLCVFVSGCSTITTSDDAQSASSGKPHPVAGQAQVTKLGSNRFKVQLTNSSQIMAKQQRDTQLCWAACVQMLLRAQKVEVTQEELADHFVDGDSNEGVGPLSMIRALTRSLDKEYCDKIDKGGRTTALSLLHLDGAPMGVSSDWLIEELSNGHPAITGLREPDTTQGHACVIVGATYNVVVPQRHTLLSPIVEARSEPMNQDQILIRRAMDCSNPTYMLEDIEMIDPDPDAPTISTLSGRDFEAQERFLITPRFAEALMREMIRTMEFPTQMGPVRSEPSSDDLEKSDKKQAPRRHRDGGSTKPEDKPKPHSTPTPKPKPEPTTTRPAVSSTPENPPSQPNRQASPKAKPGRKNDRPNPRKPK